MAIFQQHCLITYNKTTQWKRCPTVWTSYLEHSRPFPKHKSLSSAKCAELPLKQQSPRNTQFISAAAEQRHWSIRTDGKEPLWQQTGDKTNKQVHEVGLTSIWRGFLAGEQGPTEAHQRDKERERMLRERGNQQGAEWQRDERMWGRAGAGGGCCYRGNAAEPVTGFCQQRVGWRNEKESRVRTEGCGHRPPLYHRKPWPSERLMALVFLTVFAVALVTPVVTWREFFHPAATMLQSPTTQTAVNQSKILNIQQHEQWMRTKHETCCQNSVSSFL